MTTQPIAGNQNYTGISTLAQQLPKLSVGTLNSSDSSAALLTTGDSVVQTMVVGTVDFSLFSLGAVLPVVNRHGGGPITLPPSTEVLSCRYVCAGINLVDALASTFNIGFGNVAAGTAPAVATIMVGGGTALVANGATGGLVMGEQTVGDLQVFGSTGDGTGTTLVFNTPVAVNVNELVVAGVGNLTGSSGLLEVTLHYSVRR